MYYIERYLVAGSREKRKEKERTVRHKVFDRFATAGLFISFQHAVRIMKNSNKRKKKEKKKDLAWAAGSDGPSSKGAMPFVVSP